MNVFKQQIEIIRNLKYNFIDPKDLEKNFYIQKKKKKYLLL